MLAQHWQNLPTIRLTANIGPTAECYLGEILPVIQVADLLLQRQDVGKVRIFSQGLSTVTPSTAIVFASARDWIVSIVVAVVPAATLQLIIDDSVPVVFISLTCKHVTWDMLKIFIYV